MGGVRTSLTVPCSLDRAVLAIQDTLNQFGWDVLEVSTSLIVADAGQMNPFHMYNFPKVSATLLEQAGDSTKIDVSVTIVGPITGNKKKLIGIMGKFANSVSLRVQTESIAINPTVALGQGQGTGSPSQVPAAGQTRAQQLKDLKELLDAGVLTAEEFAAEKARVLDSEDSPAEEFDAEKANVLDSEDSPGRGRSRRIDTSSQHSQRWVVRQWAVRARNRLDG